MCAHSVNYAYNNYLSLYIYYLCNTTINFIYMYYYIKLINFVYYMYYIGKRPALLRIALLLRNTIGLAGSVIIIVFIFNIII